MPHPFEVIGTVITRSHQTAFLFSAPPRPQAYASSLFIQAQPDALLLRPKTRSHQPRSPSGLQSSPTRQRFSSVHHPGLRLHWATHLFHQTRSTSGLQAGPTRQCFSSAYNQAPPNSVSLPCTTQALGFIGQRFFFTRRALPPAYNQVPPDSVSLPCTTQTLGFIGQRLFFTKRASLRPTTRPHPTAFLFCAPH